MTNVNFPPLFSHCSFTQNPANALSLSRRGVPCSMRCEHHPKPGTETGAGKSHSGCAEDGCSKFNGKIIVDDCPKYCKTSMLEIKDLNIELSKILTHVLGSYVNVEFAYDKNIPEDVKRAYGEN